MSNLIERKFYAVGHLDQNDNNTTATSIPGSKMGPKPIIQGYLETILRNLEENELDCVEDGGLHVTDAAREFLMNVAASVCNAARLNQHYSIEDFRFTAFARLDGGAHLLIDYLKSKRRLTVLIPPEANVNRLSFSDHGQPPVGRDIYSPNQIEDNAVLSWLTSRSNS